MGTLPLATFPSLETVIMMPRIFEMQYVLQMESHCLLKLLKCPQMGESNSTFCPNPTFISFVLSFMPSFAEATFKD